MFGVRVESFHPMAAEKFVTLSTYSINLIFEL